MSAVLCRVGGHMPVFYVGRPMPVFLRPVAARMANSARAKSVVGEAGWGDDVGEGADGAGEVGKDGELGRDDVGLGMPAARDAGSNAEQPVRAWPWSAGRRSRAWPGAAVSAWARTRAGDGAAVRVRWSGGCIAEAARAQDEDARERSLAREVAGRLRTANGRNTAGSRRLLTQGRRLDAHTHGRTKRATALDAHAQVPSTTARRQYKRKDASAQQAHGQRGRRARRQC